jgi:hypothetical protein
VRGVRRLAVLTLVSALAGAAVLAAGVVPAWAHICPVAAEIPVGRSSTIDVGVTVENAVVADVEVDLPPGLRLDGVDPKVGWTFTRTAATVRYRGGPIQAYSCEYFSLRVSAPAPGAFGVTVVQRSAAGAVVARSIPDPNSTASHVLDQFVYAGVKPPSPPSSSNGLSSATIAGIALIGAGVVLFALIRVRDRRARRLDDEDNGAEDNDEDNGDEAQADTDTEGRDREAELRARLEEFRARTPSRRPPR